MLRNSNTYTNLDERCNLLRTVDLRKCRLLLAENTVRNETNNGLLKVKTSLKTKHSSPCSKIASGIKENLKGFDSQVEDVISCIISDVDRCFKNKTVDKSLSEKHSKNVLKIGKTLLYYLLGTAAYTSVLIQLL
ncbi:hypothetical protein POVWA2_078930 [Plasmodium ovale wallikeri]|uniref:Uncharacterized protein n=1 Tax=Plasmodium ovale wallikeri TaxID=864142 RepID=A0A1A9AHW6_PLAOA|nr:hypothetical protein POVWA1_071920 [Plasmodium ovale wallikeri]SBT57352.1 hypothetical protein POVWA2_078930 [Plasmodium ovale wallikeri]